MAVTGQAAVEPGPERGAGYSPQRAMAVVLGVVMLGSCVHTGLFTYVPLYFDARGESTVVVGSIVSLFLIAGAVGTLIAGPGVRPHRP